MLLKTFMQVGQVSGGIWREEVGVVRRGRPITNPANRQAASTLGSTLSYEEALVVMH